MMSQSWFRWHRLKTTSQRSSVPCILLAFLAPSQSQLSYSSQTLPPRLSRLILFDLSPSPTRGNSDPPDPTLPPPEGQYFCKTLYLDIIIQLYCSVQPGHARVAGANGRLSPRETTTHSREEVVAHCRRLKLEVPMDRVDRREDGLHAVSSPSAPFAFRQVGGPQPHIHRAHRREFARVRESSREFARVTA